MSHTPAPWSIEVIHVTEGAYTLSYGTNRHGDGPEGDAGKFYGPKDDAILIAAAPELLEAVEKAVNAIEAHEGWAEDGFHDDESGLISNLRGVIAKARGES